MTSSKSLLGSEQRAGAAAKAAAPPCAIRRQSSAEQEDGDRREDEICRDQRIHHDARRSQATLAEAARSHAEHDPDESGQSHEREKGEPCVGEME